MEFVLHLVTTEILNEHIPHYPISRICVRFHGSCTQNYLKSQEIMKSHEKSWKVMKSHENLKNIEFQGIKPCCNASVITLQCHSIEIQSFTHTLWGFLMFWGDSMTQNIMKSHEQSWKSQNFGIIRHSTVL